MLEFIGFLIANFVVYGGIACLVIALSLPLILAFSECWKKTVLMLAMFAGIGILSVGFAVLANMLAAIIFCGSMVGLTIGAIWDRNAVI